MRTQEEIKRRFEEVDDLFGTQKIDLIGFMDFENAKPFLSKEYVEKGEEKWIKKDNPKKEILGYLNFAYEKAKNKRGLSAMRSLLHFKTWIWLDDDEFYNEIIDSIENYTNYGIPVLNKIAKHYGFVRNK